MVFIIMTGTKNIAIQLYKPSTMVRYINWEKECVTLTLKYYCHKIKSRFRDDYQNYLKLHGGKILSLFPTFQI